jgi:flagellar FliL protein
MRPPAGSHQWFKRSLRVWVWTGIVLLLLALLTGLAWQVVRINLATIEADDEDFDKSLKPPKRLAPRYFHLDRMVVNLADPGGNRLVQLEITLELSTSKAEGQLKRLMPAIRSRLLLMVSQRYADELLQNEGKKALAADIRSELSKMLQQSAEEGESPINKVLFSSFIVQ